MSESLINIAQSWLLLAKDVPELQVMAEKRLTICDTCPNKRQLSHTGQWLTSLINDKASTFFCGICGCPLAALTIKPENSCSLGHWQPEYDSYY